MARTWTFTDAKQSGRNFEAEPWKLGLRSCVQDQRRRNYGHLRLSVYYNREVVKTYAPHTLSYLVVRAFPLMMEN